MQMLMLKLLQLQKKRNLCPKTTCRYSQTTSVFTINWIYLVTPISLSWHPRFSFSSQSYMLWKKKKKLARLCAFSLFAFLCFNYSLSTSFMFHLKCSQSNSVENETFSKLQWEQTSECHRINTSVLSASKVTPLKNEATERLPSPLNSTLLAQSSCCSLWAVTLHSLCHVYLTSTFNGD